MGNIPFWKDEIVGVCKLISSRRANLKLVLKTKNERHLLAKWFDHHVKIVGPEAIIIFDNGSTDPFIIKYYESLPPETVVVRYDGFHNAIHVVELFPDLYRALSLSADQFIFIDSDEFLVGLHNEKQSMPACDLSDYLASEKRWPVIPTIWLNDKTFSETIFKCGADDYSELEWGLAWGKPIISSNADIKGILLHNVQVDAGLYCSDVPTKILLQHLKEFMPEQRIAANREKLIKRGFASERDSIEDILKRETTGVADTNVDLYVSEIRRLRSMSAPDVLTLNEGNMEFDTDHSISYFSNKEEDLVKSFLIRDDHVAQVLIRR
jgi:hypothetical protein